MPIKIEYCIKFIFYSIYVTLKIHYSLAAFFISSISM